MGKVVCVTGASGYIASWLVKLLLNHGYTVKATVRNLGDPSKTEHLNAFEGAKERLQLFEANLVEQGSFDAVIDGCDGVFHTASPVILENVIDPQRQLIEPAVKGTLNVLSSCARTPSVKRVVLTSSMASVMVNREMARSTNDDIVVDETSFSDPVFCEENKAWYVLSKTLAERDAMKFADENGIDLLVMNPGFVIGPLLQPTLNHTFDCFLTLIREGNSPGMPGGVFVFVDVRDVADAHVLAFENPSANGRYCLVGEVVSTAKTLSILRDLYPTLICSEGDEAAIPLVKVSKEKAKSLGINFTSLEQSLKDSVESLKERNFI